MDNEGSITRLLRRYNAGDRSAVEEVIPILYGELRRLARQRLRLERPGHTLQTTALVHECYLRLIESRQLAAQDRNDFLAIASETMRRVLVDYARTRHRLKRGGDAVQVPFDEAGDWLSEREVEEVLSLDTAIEKLRAADARAARVVQLRFFGGLSAEETAEVLQVSAKTVHRSWLASRAWLRKEIGAVP